MNEFLILVLINDCKTLYHSVSDKAGKISMEITRESQNVNETLEILVENTSTNEIYLRNFLNSIDQNTKNYKKSIPDYEQDLIDNNKIQPANLLFNDNDYNKNLPLNKNVTIAVPNKDYEPIKQIVKFQPGEMIKVYPLFIFCFVIFFTTLILIIIYFLI